MRSGIFVVFVVLLVAVVSPSSAATSQTASGTQEWGGAFSFSYSGYSKDQYDRSITVAAIGPGYGYFVADNVELRTDLAVTFLSYGNGGSESQTTIGMDAQVLFHFGSETNVVPFFGGGAGFGIASDSSSTEYDPMFVVPIVTGGMRVFLTDSGCLTLAATYSHQINGLYSEDVSGNIFGISASYSIFRF